MIKRVVPLLFAIVISTSLKSTLNATLPAEPEPITDNSKWPRMSGFLKKYDLTLIGSLSVATLVYQLFKMQEAAKQKELQERERLQKEQVMQKQREEQETNAKKVQAEREAAENAEKAQKERDRNFMLRKQREKRAQEKFVQKEKADPKVHTFDFGENGVNVKKIMVQV